MRLYISITFLLLALCANAQKSVMIFYNPNKAEAIQARKGGLLVLKYRGYLQQMELESNYILALNDSTITMGKPRLFSKPINTKTIRIEDINGFRKISAGAMFLKSTLTIGATLGTYYAVRSHGDHLNSSQQILLSTGAGLLTNISLKLIFPDNKIKHTMKDGWKIMVR